MWSYSPPSQDIVSSLLCSSLCLLPSIVASEGDIWTDDPQSCGKQLTISVQFTISHCQALSAQSQDMDDVDAHVDGHKRPLDRVPFAHVPPVFGLFSPRTLVSPYVGLGLSLRASTPVDYKSTRTLFTSSSAISSFIEWVTNAWEALFLALQDLSDLSPPESEIVEVESLPPVETLSSAGPSVDTHGSAEVGIDIRLYVVESQSDDCCKTPSKLNRNAPVFIPRAAILKLVPNTVRPRSKRKVKTLTTPARGKENRWTASNISSEARSRIDAFILQARAKSPAATNPDLRRRKGVGNLNPTKDLTLALSSVVVILEPQTPSETSSSTSATFPSVASSPPSPALVTSESLLSQGSSPQSNPSTEFYSSLIPAVQSMSDLPVVRDAPLAIACTVSLNNLAQV